uniref:Putative lipocalin-6 1 n=1 Tax=Amblyomma parvum TaxID=251391 RepID=A0A023G2N0_AMBPA
MAFRYFWMWPNSPLLIGLAPGSTSVRVQGSYDVVEKMCFSQKLHSSSLLRNPFSPCKLLQPESKFYLVQTTMQHLEVDTYRCITVDIIERDEGTHRVMLTVGYQIIPKDQWLGFSQNFQFYISSGGYNKMESIGTEGPPSATYVFLNWQPSCVVVRAEVFSRHDIEPALPKKQDVVKDGDGSQNGNCMLWKKIDSADSGEEDCLEKFKNLCNNQHVRQRFSRTNCQNRTVGSVSEEESPTLQD